jgi:outer membrane protein TolC
LVKAQGERAIDVETRNAAAELARVTSTFAKVGQNRPADAERAATELAFRETEIQAADAAIIEASARLTKLLNLESSVQLQSSENWIVPRPIVPDPIPLPELIAIALYNRPEVAEWRAEVNAAMLELDGAKLLLFSPQFIAGFSDGAFGGGSDFNADTTGSPRFGKFGNRTDADIVLYWSIRNLGLANRAMVQTATARLAATAYEQTSRLNQIRAEVADAYAKTQSRSAQLDVRHRAVKTSELGYREDLQRALAGEGRPIEVLDSLRLRGRTQREYLETIADYNRAHYELYVAIGQPPADLLIHSDAPIIGTANDSEAP